jgi:NAD(P) transhydrogenase subunit alpha
MTQIAIPNEIAHPDKRTAMTPINVSKLVRAGAEVVVQTGLGAFCGYPDEQYQEAGAKIVIEREELFKSADMVLRIHKPLPDEVSLLKQGSVHISFLDPFNDSSLVERLRDQQVSAISMEMIPRTTRAQKMDALSSQASLAGYVMVLKAANQLNRILPMMMTPAGTIKPAKVFVIGAGVAGLQAIATAKRLGARVTAFDTREVVAEQVESLGATFFRIDLGETGQTEDGYARELTPEQVVRQQKGQAEEIAKSDIVITTAQVFGRKPPLLVSTDTIKGMQPGSVIVDMAAETGGNVEGSVAGEVVELHGVTIIGSGNWAEQVCRDASNMYSNNLFNLVDEYWDTEKEGFVLNLADEIITGCLITHAGDIVNPRIREQYA